MKRILKLALARLGYSVQGTRCCPRQLFDAAYLRSLELDDVVSCRMFECGRELTFVQIGGFDGVTGDPLHKHIAKHGWRGVVVEPQSRAVSKLRDLYRGNDRIVILQAALDCECRSRKLYTIESETAPQWAGGLASFRRETIVKHSGLVPGLETMIKEEYVECITFEQVLEYLPGRYVDVLQIDAEGADGYILSLFPLERVRPAIIHWEVKHLTKTEKEDCLDRLISFCYKFAPSGGEDMLAVHIPTDHHPVG